MSNEAYKFHVITPDEEEIKLVQEGERFLAEGLNTEFETLFSELMKKPHLREAFMAIFQEMSKSGEIAIASTDKSLTSQEAANFLGVSRPHLNKLLDNSIVPFHKTGSHRRVYFRDVLEYKKKRDGMSRGLADLVEESQKHKLGWE